MENIELKDGYVLDFCSKKPVDIKKPEEIVRQQYEKTLFEDFNYDCEMMDIEVTIQRGEKNSKKNKEENLIVKVNKLGLSLVIAIFLIEFLVVLDLNFSSAFSKFGTSEFFFIAK